jgi:hypothetical protein
MRVAYARDVSVEIGGLRGMVTFVLSALHCPSALTRYQRQARSMPEQFVAHVGPELFCHIEEGIQSYLLSPLVRGISK